MRLASTASSTSRQSRHRVLGRRGPPGRRRHGPCPYRGQWKKPSDAQQAVNRSYAKIRALLNKHRHPQPRGSSARFTARRPGLRPSFRLSSAHTWPAQTEDGKHSMKGGMCTLRHIKLLGRRNNWRIDAGSCSAEHFHRVAMLYSRHATKWISNAKHLCADIPPPAWGLLVESRSHLASAAHLVDGPAARTGSIAPRAAGPAPSDSQTTSLRLT